MREIEGKHFYKICDYLNQNGYKPQRTSIFTPENVFGIYRKMNLRKLRLEVKNQINVNEFLLKIFEVTTKNLSIKKMFYKE